MVDETFCQFDDCLTPDDKVCRSSGDGFFAVAGDPFWEGFCGRGGWGIQGYSEPFWMGILGYSWVFRGIPNGLQYRQLHVYPIFYTTWRLGQVLEILSIRETL